MATDSPVQLFDRATLSRWNHAIGPVAAGMIIDALDLLTLGPLGLAAGIPVGMAAGFWLARSLGLERRLCWTCAVAAGVYCMIPFTEVLPLGTLVGAICRFQNQDATSAGENQDIHAAADRPQPLSADQQSDDCLQT